MGIKKNFKEEKFNLNLAEAPDLECNTYSKLQDFIL